MDEPVDENLGQEKLIAGEKVMGGNHSRETIVSLALPLASANRLPVVRDGEEKKTSTSGRLKRDSKRNREREKGEKKDGLL